MHSEQIENSTCKSTAYVWLWYILGAKEKKGGQKYAYGEAPKVPYHNIHFISFMMLFKASVDNDDDSLFFCQWKKILWPFVLLVLSLLYISIYTNVKDGNGKKN